MESMCVESVWLVGVVVRRYIDFLLLLILTPLITYPYPYSSCIFCSFLQQHPYFLFLFYLIYRSVWIVVAMLPPVSWLLVQPVGQESAVCPTASLYLMALHVEMLAESVTLLNIALETQQTVLKMFTFKTSLFAMVMNLTAFLGSVIPETDCAWNILKQVRF